MPQPTSNLTLLRAKLPADVRRFTADPAVGVLAKELGLETALARVNDPFARTWLTLATFQERQTRSETATICRRLRQVDEAVGNEIQYLEVEERMASVIAECRLRYSGTDIPAHDRIDVTYNWLQARHPAIALGQALGVPSGEGGYRERAEALRLLADRLRNMRPRSAQLQAARILEVCHALLAASRQPFDCVGLQAAPSLLDLTAVATLKRALRPFHLLGVRDLAGV